MAFKIIYRLKFNNYYLKFNSDFSNTITFEMIQGGQEYMC